MLFLLKKFPLQLGFVLLKFSLLASTPAVLSSDAGQLGPRVSAHVCEREQGAQFAGFGFFCLFFDFFHGVWEGMWRKYSNQLSHYTHTHCILLVLQAPRVTQV